LASRAISAQEGKRFHRIARGRGHLPALSEGKGTGSAERGAWCHELLRPQEGGETSRILPSKGSGRSISVREKKVAHRGKRGSGKSWGSPHPPPKKTKGKERTPKREHHFFQFNLKRIKRKQKQTTPVAVVSDVAEGEKKRDLSCLTTKGGGDPLHIGGRNF